MFLLPSAAHFLEFQIWHYQQLLKTAPNKQTTDFLTTNISNLQKS